MDLSPFVVASSCFNLKDFDPAFAGGYKNKSDVEEEFRGNQKRIGELQRIMYAQNMWGVWAMFQAMDGAGKDSTVGSVFSEVTPVGLQVFSWAEPSKEELDHSYMWRCLKAEPERGRIGVHIRSYYEEVLVVRVHPEILAGQRLPSILKDDSIWTRRFMDIENFEKYLTSNGYLILKFFLHISRKKQKKEQLERIKDPEKNWKFSLGDIERMRLWPQYMEAHEEMIRATSTPECPWYVIPADHRWFAKALVADIVVQRMESLGLEYPELTIEKRKQLQRAKKILRS